MERYLQGEQVFMREEFINREIFVFHIRACGKERKIKLATELTALLSHNALHNKSCLT